MLICTKCGVQNELGRVFCVKCGGKLDLSAMTSQAVAESVRLSWFAMHWGKLVALVVVLLLVLVGLALWSSPQRLGAEGKSVSGRRVQSDIAILERVSKGRAMRRTFTEEGINGYFEFIVKRDLKNAVVSVDVMDGWCMIKVVQNLGKIPLKFFNVSVSTSLELKCSAVGGRLRVRGVKMGHLPIYAPFRTMIVKRVHGQISGLKDWKPLTSLDEITMTDGKINVVYKK